MNNTTVEQQSAFNLPLSTSIKEKTKWRKNWHAKNNPCVWYIHIRCGIARSVYSEWERAACGIIFSAYAQRETTHWVLGWFYDFPSLFFSFPSSFFCVHWVVVFFFFPLICNSTAAIFYIFFHFSIGKFVIRAYKQTCPHVSIVSTCVSSVYRLITENEAWAWAYRNNRNKNRLCSRKWKRKRFRRCHWHLLSLHVAFLSMFLFFIRRCSCVAECWHSPTSPTNTFAAENSQLRRKGTLFGSTANDRKNGNHYLIQTSKCERTMHKTFLSKFIIIVSTRLKHKQKENIYII